MANLGRTMLARSREKTRTSPPPLRTHTKEKEYTLLSAAVVSPSTKFGRGEESEQRREKEVKDLLGSNLIPALSPRPLRIRSAQTTCWESTQRQWLSRQRRPPFRLFFASATSKGLPTRSGDGDTRIARASNPKAMQPRRSAGSPPAQNWTT